MKYYRKGTKARKASMRRRAVARSGVRSISSSVRAREDGPSLSSGFAKAVLSVVNRKEETKYVSTQVGGVNIGGLLTVPSGLNAAIPKVAQGVGSFQRIGQKINMARGKIDFQFYLIPATGAQYPTQDVWVKIFILNSKQVKSVPLISSLQPNTLLDQGDGTTTDWSTTTGAGAYQFMPLSKEDFSGHVKTIKLTKNQGQANGDLNPGTAPNTFGRVGAVWSYTWNHKGTLIYDEAPTGANYPTNFAPLYAFVAMNSDQTPYQGLVDVQTRLHMWYKDT